MRHIFVVLFVKTLTLIILSASRLDCRGWRPEGAANVGHFNQSFDNVTRKAAHVPVAAVPDCRPKPPVVCSPPPVPATEPQRALHGWKPPRVFATWWVTTVIGLRGGLDKRQEKQLSIPKTEKKKGNKWLSLVVPTNSVCGVVTVIILLEEMLINKQKSRLRFHVCFKAIGQLSNLLYF